MSSLFGTGGSKTQQPVRYTAINLTTSSQGLPIPLGWGAFRAGANILWYNDFKAVASSRSAGGKGGSSGTTSYDYSAAVILGICEGQISGINQVWSNRDVTTLAALNLTTYVGSAGQAPPPFVTSNYPMQALAYANTAYVFSSKYALGSSPDLPSHNFEVFGPLFGTGAPGYYDANPADIAYDYLTSPRYGAGLPASAIDAASMGIGETVGSGWWTYCRALPVLFSPYLNQQEQGVNTLHRWAQLTNTWIFWSGDRLKFRALGDADITANGVTYTPSITLAAALTLDDFIVANPGDLPVAVTRSDPLDGYNRVQIDCLERANSYNAATVQWQDQTSIDQFGELQAQSVSASEICVPSMAAISAALIGQRAVWVRNKYRFTLGYNHVLLEVGDIVSLYEPIIGLLAQTVRITEIQESDNQLLDITAEEFNLGVGSVTNALAQAAQASQAVNKLVDPGDVNAPMLIEPPATITAGAPALWIGLSGGANWGGARIYASFDGGDTYTAIGSVFTGLAQGVLTSPLSDHTDPDLVNVLAVDLDASDGTLPAGATTADADALRTMILVDNEIMSYGAVAIGAGPNQFTLSYLRRGQYGTTAAYHAAGAIFTRIDSLYTFTYSVPTGYDGYTVYFKFQSFNVFGNSLQDLSAVTAYPYTIISSGGSIPGPGGGGTPGGGGEGPR